MAHAWFVQVRNFLDRWLLRLAQRVSVDAVGAGMAGSMSLSVISPQLRSDELPVSPSRPYSEDLLGRETFGDGLTRLVDYGGGTGVVLIDAGWGNGKTTFLRMWVQKARNDGKVVASLNAWDGDYRDTPLEYTRKLHKVAPHLAYADHPASSSRAANPESFSVCATPRNASVPRVRLPHPCEANTHAPMYSKSPTLKGRASQGNFFVRAAGRGNGSG